jgi:hypothetical protein
MARKPKINLATAKQADGALAAPRDIYSIVGLSATPYRIKGRADYSKWLESANLDELHEEAYRVGVMTHPDRRTQLARLEQKFIQESTKFGAGIPEVQNPTISAEDRAAAEKILSRGR